MFAFLQHLFPPSPLAAGLAPAAEPNPEAHKENPMKFADLLRGAAVLVADVAKVFDEARTAVAAVPFLPQNLKDDLTETLNDAQGDLNGAAALAGTVAGGALADAVDDTTTLFMNTANAISGSKSLAEFSKAELVVLQKAWQAARAQGDTLLAQAMAGIDPTKSKAA
jgi:hypothetical protein